MFLKKKKTEEDNIMNDKDLKERVKKAKFVFSYNYGYLITNNKYQFSINELTLYVLYTIKRLVGRCI